MTLVSSLITDAYRESNMLPLGVSASANQVTEALRLHNQILSAIYGGEAGERLEDWPLGTFDRDATDFDYLLPYSDRRLHHPPINQRLIVTNTEATTIYLSVKPQDGARMGIADPYSRLSTVPITLDGNGRPIEAAATLLLNTDGLFREWIYRADLAAWVRVTDVLATDNNPFPSKYDIMFIIMLAMRLNPRYGHSLAPESLQALKTNKREFVARYLQSRPLEIDDSISWPFMSRQGYDTQRAFNSQQSFNRGTYGE